MEHNYDLIATATQIDNTINAMAEQIIKDYPTTPLFVALMRGAAPFASKLMFAIAKLNVSYHPELDYMMVSTYGHNRTASQPVIVTDLAPSTIVKGRDIVLLDDVIDQGITSDFVKDLLLCRGAISVKLAVLATKDVPARKSQADYYGFDAGDKWLVGMGLDDAKVTNEAYRWTSDIWEIRH